MLPVDTNVLQDDPQWAEWPTRQLRAQAKLHALALKSSDLR
jgi:hypothetical protein